MFLSAEFMGVELDGLVIAFLAVSALVAVAAVVALVMRIIVVIRYFRANRMEATSGHTGITAARAMLDANGMQDVQVKKANFLRAWFFGNSYSLSKRTIFLRPSIANKKSITAIGLALQKVGIAEQCRAGDQKTLTRNSLQILGVFGPFMFLPLIIIGVILDIVLFQFTGVASLVSVLIGLAFIIAGFVVTLLNIPVEKAANRRALELIDATNFLTPEERTEIEKVFGAYIIAYIAEFILSVLRLIQLVLKLLIQLRR